MKTKILPDFRICISVPLKNYCNPKNIDFTDKGNLKEQHLGQKMLHLNRKGNSILANNLKRFLKSNFCNNCTDSNCSRINNAECISELSEVNTEDVSFESLKEIQIKNLTHSILSLRNKFDLLADQIKGNVGVLAISETKLGDSFRVTHHLLG